MIKGISNLVGGLVLVLASYLPQLEHYEIGNSKLLIAGCVFMAYGVILLVKQYINKAKS